MAELSIIPKKLSAYVSSANEVVEIKLVRTIEDIEDESKTFHPDFTHQLFGDKECIFGYKDLRIRLYYTAARLTTYLSMTYTDKVTPQRYEGVQADEVVSVIADKLQEGFLTNLSDFITAVPKDKSFRPYGEKLYEYSSKQDPDKLFEIYKVDSNNSRPGFQDHHERLQTFVLWYIDAASFINADDEKWHFYLIYEKYQHDNETAHAIIGYCTVYHYYAYPNKLRPRISQMLILPPFQGQGHGAELLQAIYNNYTCDRSVLDITVEDPSDNFTRLRDYVDAKNCKQLPSFHPDNLNNGFSEDMAKEAQAMLKINKRQARRIYEILRLLFTNKNNMIEYKSYRLDVKRRLNIPYQKQCADMEKLKRSLHPDEFRATMQFQSPEQRIERLEKQYEELETSYEHILERLALLN